MPSDEVAEISRIRERLCEVTRQFEREMRERGFDPQQADTVPLTPSMARLRDEQRKLEFHLAALTHK